MIRLSNTARYAIRAVAHIAKQPPNTPAIGHQIAQELTIPEGFLLRILVMLARARVLRSIKGPRGGYLLARAAKEITVLDILEVIDGPIGGEPDRIEVGNSVVAKRLNSAVQEAAELMRDQLKKTNISELAGIKGK